MQSSDFEVLLFAYSLNGEPVQILDLKCGQAIPAHILDLLFDPGCIKHAYNAAFEWYCLSKHFGRLLPINQWQCTMFHGLYCGYTAGLAATGEALGLSQDKKKLGIGLSLIRTFCIPQKPTKTNGNRTRILPEHEPEKWNIFKRYCLQDVVTEMEIENKLSAFPVPDSEQYLWQLDQWINARGVAIDQNLVDGALAIGSKATSDLKNEAKKLTGLDNPNSVAQLLSWYEDETGEELEDLRKDTVKSLLVGDFESPAVKRVLQIRQELGKTSIKKYAAMHDAVCADGRVRGLLQFYGANRTGRWAGRLVQVQNLPRNYIETLSLARELTSTHKLDAMRLIYGNVPDTLSQLIRTAFVPSPGNVFCVADFSAIEARVIAWLAGEKWVMDVFAGHGKIYEATASQMFGVPIELISKGNPEYALRQKGKVATLALGYQGSSGALINMGALNMGLPEDELPDIVTRWRTANKRIVDLWHSVERCAIEAFNGNPCGTNGLLFARETDVKNGLDFLTITLPSKRKLYYAKPFLAPGKFDNMALHYYGVNQTSKKWCIVPTYGGKLTENIVQAIARDCLAVSMRRLEDCGYPIVMHIHDEVVVDTPNAESLKNICDIMGSPIDWAHGLLLRADGFVTDYYKKE